MFCNIATINKMAKIVLAGRSDCPYFARCELLGDKLAKNLKKFKLHKVVIQPDKWENWLNETCTERGWMFNKSPIIWRELIDRGGKGVLIGDANDFQEYAKAYYNVESEMNSFDMLRVGNENKISKDIFDEEETTFNALSKPVHICITNAVSPFCYYLINCLYSGQILGPGVEFTIRLLAQSSADVDQIKGLAMEAEDLACGGLRNIKVCTDSEEAFMDCSYIIVLDTFYKTRNETLKEWIDRNQQFFSSYAAVMNNFALPTCKVLLSNAGPLNFNAMVISENAPNLDRKNIMVVSSVLENQAKSLIAEKLKVNQAGVTNLVVWGNINGKCYFDLSKCKVYGHSGAVKGPNWHSVNAVDLIYENKWITTDLPKLASLKYNKILDVQGFLSGLSVANAIANTFQQVCRGSPSAQIFSLGVNSEGWYGVPHGLVFSFPVMMDSMGSWSVVEDFDITKEARLLLDDAIQDINYLMLVCAGVSKHAQLRVPFGNISSVSRFADYRTDPNENRTFPTTSMSQSAKPENKQIGSRQHIAMVPVDESAGKSLETGFQDTLAISGSSLPESGIPDSQSTATVKLSGAALQDGVSAEGVDAAAPRDDAQEGQGVPVDGEQEGQNDGGNEGQQLTDDDGNEGQQLAADDDSEEQQLMADGDTDGQQLQDDNEGQQLQDDNEGQ